MKNTKYSASKEQQQSPRSPLQVKDLNVSSSFSSSTTATSISSETPRGCLRFLLSHHSSTVSKNTSNRKPRSYSTDNTPKSVPNVKHLRGKLSCNGDNVVKNRNHLQNLKKPTSKNVQKLKKKPPTPCLYSWKSGRKPSSRLDLSDRLSKFSVNSDIKMCKNAVKFNPVNKIGSGSALGSADCCSKAVELDEKEPSSDETNSPIPPIQASLSPEIQGGSTSVIKETPTTCYAAGHVLSGVSDKRKCRPRGLLTFGDNDLFGCSNIKVFHSDDEDVVRALNKSRVSLVPSPIEASMHWILSPCDERSKDKDDDDDDDECSLRLDECENSMPLKSIGCSSSPSSSLGFSSKLCSKSNSTVTASDATTGSHSCRSRSSEFRGILWPSFDHMVCSLSPASPANVPSSMVEVSPKEEKHPREHERETTPCSEDSIGSENVIQTPQSNSSLPSFGLSHLSRDEISRLWFECELNSVAEVLRRVSLSPECEPPMLDSSRTSFEFNPLIRPDDSIDLAIFRRAMNSQISPEIPEPMRHGLPESEVRISWREGLASRIYEMDEFDCCRCFSDEEADDANCGSNPCASGSCSEVMNSVYNKIWDSVKDPKSQENEETNLNLELRIGDGSSDVAEDFSWKVCDNHLFQV